MNFKKYIQALIFLMSTGCGVERGVPTDTLPLSPSEETLNKKKLVVDPAGYSGGIFTYALGHYGTLASGSDGSVYSFMTILYETVSSYESRPKAFKFLPNGTIDTTWNPVDRYEDTVEDFNLGPSSAFVNAANEVYLLSNKTSGKDLASVITGTSIIKFTSAGYVDAAFGVKGSVNSTEKGYEKIIGNDQFLSIGGKSIRRFSLAGVIDKTFAGSGNLADVPGNFAVAPDQSVFLDNKRFDPLGVQDDDFSYLNFEFSVVGWNSAENAMIYFKDGGTAEPEVAAVNADGTSKNLFGDNGYTKLTWLIGTRFEVEKMSGNRILAYRKVIVSGVDYEDVEYAVFNGDGTRIAAFGAADTGLCKVRMRQIDLLELLPSGKVLITGTKDSQSVVSHMGDACLPVAVE